MGRQKRRQSHTSSTSPSRKQWHPDFSLNRRRDRAVGDRLFMELLGEMACEPLEAFLRDSEISGPSWSGKKVRKFFRETDRTPTGKLWVDHRYQSDRNLDVRPIWLFADELAGLLREQRTRSASSLDTVRHLTFVPCLAPDLVEKLIVTATRNEIDALRPAVCQHIAGETLIRVHIPAEGFSTFQLILNVPYLVLGDAVASSDSSAPSDGQVMKEWADLSYLPLETDKGEQSNSFVIYESQTTIVISGYDDSKWFGYAFGYIGPGDPTPDEDETVTCEQEEDLGLRPVEDLFATGGSHTVFNLQIPIWDPRVYFLCAAHARLDIAAQAYELLVRTIEAGASDWISKVQEQDHASNEKALKEITELTKLLQRLRKHFSQAILAWERFSGTGDVSYFVDLRSDHLASEALSGIEKSFEKIIDLERILTLMESNSGSSIEILKLQIAQENNRMTNESNFLTRKMTGINLKTSSHSENAARSAAKGTRAAEETSRATRVNVQLFWCTTAFIIALQYFCSDRALFAFERTPTTFWISIVILMPSLALLSLILYTVDYIKEFVTERWRKDKASDVGGSEIA